MLGRVEFELDDLLDTSRAKNTRNTNVVTINTELAVKQSADWQDAFLILEDRLGHCNGCRSRAVESATCFEQLNNFAASSFSTLDHSGHNFFCLGSGFILILKQFHYWNALNACVANQRNHGVAMTTEGHCGNVFDRYFELPSDECCETCGVENASLTNNALCREAGDFAAQGNHSVERIGDYDDDCIRCVDTDAFSNCGHDLGVNFDQVIAAHARLTRQASSNDNNVGACNISVAVGASARNVKTVNW